MRLPSYDYDFESVFLFIAVLQLCNNYNIGFYVLQRTGVYVYVCAKRMCSNHLKN